MRLGHDSGWIKNSSGRICGVSCGADFTAEHKDCFFSNANQESILDWAAKNNSKLEFCTRPMDNCLIGTSLRKKI